MKKSLLGPSKSGNSPDNTTHIRSKVTVPTENNAVITSEIVPVHQGITNA